jgi:hypothetical protein
VFDPNNPNPTYQPGMMHTMNALAPGQMPMQPGADAAAERARMPHLALIGRCSTIPRSRRCAAIHAAMQGFQDWRSQIGDWRGLMDQYKMDMRGYHQQGHGGPMMNPGGGVRRPARPQLPNTQFPLNPQGMVGQSYGVQGMTPATSPFGLPTY